MQLYNPFKKNREGKQNMEMCLTESLREAVGDKPQVGCCCQMAELKNVDKRRKRKRRVALGKNMQNSFIEAVNIRFLINSYFSFKDSGLDIAVDGVKY